jgi:mediator of RNA polymerase II transcription subunit 12
MEQCLGKDIPLPRAVWLAKCVGANELRAFRRKGVSGAAAASGESKWVGEWTVHVEQFLEGVIASCGQPQWQAKMDYAVKLATSFYTERLLERDHYLDWIVSSFAEAAPEALPVWTIMVQLYWKDVIMFVKRGRKLAEATLNILHQTCRGSLWIGDALKARLKKLIVVMAVTNRGCLIIPRAWERYSYLLVPSAIGSEHSTSDGPAQNVMRRNTRLTRPLRKTPQTTRSAFMDLYTLLDMVGLHVDIERLTTSCLASVADVPKLVPALLNWSASVYRAGQSRVYLAAGVLSQLCKRGYDTDDFIMGFLRTESTAPLVVNNVYRVVGELIRADCFSTGRYLQWLMTSGSLSRGNSSSLSNGLLAALPLDALQPHLLNSRNMLLRRMGSIEDEPASVEAVVAQIDSCDADDGNEPVVDLSALSESAKLEVARRTSIKAAARAKGGMASLRYFCGIRTALEVCGDHRTLADVVQSGSLADDPALLTTIANTVNMHAKSFGAMGCLQSLLGQLLERYNAMRSQQPLDRKFTLALMGLVKRFPDRHHIVGHLEQDLAICEQQNSMNVCSPASDNIVSMQASNLASDSDIDAVFASGNNMDEQLMQRVFSRIVQRARKTNAPDSQFPSKVCGWLDQLRAVAVDPSSFDQMALNHVRACLKASEQVVAPCNMITAIVASGCTSFATMAEEVKAPTAAAIVVRLLLSDTTMYHGLHAAEAYQYRVQQQLFCSTHADRVVQLFITAMEYPDLPLDDENLANLVLDYAVAHYQDVMKALASNAWSQVFLANCSRLATKILGLGRPLEAKQNLDVRSIVANADPLSIVPCAAALQLQSILTPEQSDDVQQAVLDAISNGSEVWPQLLGSVGQGIVQEIYQWARDQVMSKAFEHDGFDTFDQASIIRSLDILDVTFHAAKEGDCGSIVPIIIEKLKTLDTQLGAVDMTSRGGQAGRQVLRSLHVLLHLSVLYSSTSGVNSESLDQSYCQLLSALSTILVHPKLQGQQELLEYIFDVSSTLADNISEASLSMLARSISGRDALLSSLFGTCPLPDAWLAVVSHPHLQGTPQQRVLMKQQPGSQQQVSGRQPHQQSPVQQQHGFQRPPAAVRAEGRSAMDTKTVPFPLRRWEIMSDATPMVGDNDTSLSLGLFGARKV